MKEQLIQLIRPAQQNEHLLEIKKVSRSSTIWGWYNPIELSPNHFTNLANQITELGSRLGWSVLASIHFIQKLSTGRVWLSLVSWVGGWKARDNPAAGSDFQEFAIYLPAISANIYAFIHWHLYSNSCRCISKGKTGLSPPSPFTEANQIIHLFSANFPDFNFSKRVRASVENWRGGKFLL